MQAPASNQAQVNTPSGPPHETTHDAVIDITALLCPMTFVRTRLALDRLQTGQVLAVRLTGDEPRRNVPRTAMEQGHTVLNLADHPDGTATVLIRKGSPPHA